MRILLDTHLILWWEMGSTRLPKELHKWIGDADAVFISQASLWEMAIKTAMGKLRVDIALFEENITEHGFQWLKISNSHLLEVATLPIFDDHKDPFDRLLIAQSKLEPLLLLTGDKKLSRYGEHVRLI